MSIITRPAPFYCPLMPDCVPLQVAAAHACACAPAVGGLRRRRSPPTRPPARLCAVMACALAFPIVCRDGMRLRLPETAGALNFRSES